MQKQQVTLSDVAKKAGVAKSTASMVLNNRARKGTVRISDQTIERVRKVAHEMGYFVGLTARAKAGSRTSIIGLIMYSISPTGSQLQMIEGITEVFRKEKVTLAMGMVTRDNLELELEEIHIMAQKGFDGLILEPSTGLLNMLDANPELIPNPDRVVILNRPPIAGLPAAWTNEEECGFIAAQHLLDQGHQNIAVLGDQYTFLSSKFDAHRTQVQRFWGFQKALQAHGLSAMRARCLEDVFDLDGVTGVFCGLGPQATELLGACLDRDIRVPEDLSIVGYNNSVEKNQVRPKITTIDKKASKLGQQAAKMILEARDGKRPEDVILTPELIVRESTRQVSPPRVRL